MCTNPARGCSQITQPRDPQGCPPPQPRAGLRWWALFGSLGVARHRMTPKNRKTSSSGARGGQSVAESDPVEARHIPWCVDLRTSTQVGTSSRNPWRVGQSTSAPQLGLTSGANYMRVGSHRSASDRTSRRVNPLTNWEPQHHKLKTQAWVPRQATRDNGNPEQAKANPEQKIAAYRRDSRPSEFSRRRSAPSGGSR